MNFTRYYNTSPRLRRAVQFITDPTPADLSVILTLLGIVIFINLLLMLSVP